jgi:hypothetical protein
MLLTEMHYLRGHLEKVIVIMQLIFVVVSDLLSIINHAICSTINHRLVNDLANHQLHFFSIYDCYCSIYRTIFTPRVGHTPIAT